MKYLPVVQTAFSAKSLAAARVLLPLFYVLLSLPLCVHAAGSLTLDSTSLAYQVTIPVDYTCDGKDISPELEWKNPPANTQSYVLMLADPDAPGGTFYHWILYNLPPALTNLPEGASSLPKGALTGQNSFGKNQYNGPCPPSGTSHRYVFSIYALNTVLKLANGADAYAVIQAMQNHVIDVAELKLSFGH